MSLTNAQYNAIMRKYEERQLASRRLLECRLEEVREACPGYQDLEYAISSVSVAQGKKLLAGDAGAMEELKSLLAELKLQMQDKLAEGGFTADYLSPVYTCSDCKDTGYIEGEKCHCFKQAIIDLLYQQSHIHEMIEHENFDNLSYEYYEDDDLKRFQYAVTTSKNFVKNFNSDYQNLLFYGTVGTGKSFLSGCIAKALLEKGNNVLYFSAAQLFQELSAYTMDYQNKEVLQNLYHDLYHCDLLIIDDMGTEPSNAYISSQLFTILNERHNANKSTIISTNFTLEELGKRYSERIFSRITSHYNLCRLTGKDIRMYKKRMLNRK